MTGFDRALAASVLAGGALAVLLGGCSGQGTADGASGSGRDARAEVAAAKIKRCLEATGGTLPTLYPPDPRDIPRVRDTPAACRGIERQVQDSVHRAMLEDCARATYLLGQDPATLPEAQRSWVARQIRACVGGNPDIFYW